MTTYRVIKPYTCTCFGFPLMIPTGTIGTAFNDCYTFHLPGSMYVPWVSKWAVESWGEYFEAVR